MRKPSYMLAQSTHFVPANMVRFPMRTSTAAVFRDEIEDAERRRQIEAIAHEWFENTAHLSQVTRYSQHLSFATLVTFGADAAEFAIDRLRAGDIQQHWLILLKAIYDTNPTAPQHMGRASLQAQDWIRWFDERRQDR